MVILSRGKLTLLAGFDPKMAEPQSGIKIRIFHIFHSWYVWSTISRVQLALSWWIFDSSRRYICQVDYKLVQSFFKREKHQTIANNVAPPILWPHQSQYKIFKRVTKRLNTVYLMDNLPFPHCLKSLSMSSIILPHVSWNIVCCSIVSYLSFYQKPIVLIIVTL